MNKNKDENKAAPDSRPHFPGYPKYPAEEDIYKRSKEEEFTEDESSKPVAKGDESPGADLDIPGAELDDSDEKIGAEDEENNYYSLDDDNEEDPEAS